MKRRVDWIRESVYGKIKGDGTVRRVFFVCTWTYHGTTTYRCSAAILRKAAPVLALRGAVTMWIAMECDR